ncbi:MAG TPA: rhomboid family intramembrane serine protease [Phycisphaerae bacterium]|nr:rhomboid family intramembrane serine protease [Phycisphaerae bacterium]
MIIPIRTDYRLSRRPWMNYALVIANVVVFLAGFHGGNDRLVRQWLLDPGVPRLAQFFTSVFLHAGWPHLIGNMIFLWVFGNAINDRFGPIGYLAFYLGGGVAAGILYVLAGGWIPALGASGAICAVTGAYLVLLPRTRVTVVAWLFYVLLPFEISSLFFIAFQFVHNLLMGFTQLGGHAGGVAYWAHIGGYVFGIAVAAAMLATRVLPRDAFDLLSLIRTGHRRQRYRRMVWQGYDPFGVGKAGFAANPSRRVSARSLTTATPDNEMARELQARREISEACARHDTSAAADRYLELLAIAPDAVLPRQQQLDVANQLMSSERYAQAADAYERFLRHYGTYEHLADIYLMLGLLYGRYLQEYDKAEQYLEKAIQSSSDPRKVELARYDLELIHRHREG